MPKILPFSKSFNALIDQNYKICDGKADTNVCGWGAGGDSYLNAQEIDPNLNYGNSRISITEVKVGIVTVHLNVYPSSEGTENSYDRSITYRMIEEGSQWVVDDILYDEQSSRKQIQNEIDYYRQQ